MVTREDIDAALRNEELTLHFQPILSLPLERIVGFEALLRWGRAGHVASAPVELISLAEQTGQIVDVGRWVLDCACAAAARLRHACGGSLDVTMSVNVSSRQWADPSLLHDVQTAVAQHGLAPRDLRLELTESSLVQAPQTTRAAIVQFKEYGVGTCIDDFGTGYASLGYMSDFPVDTIKIDKSFVWRMHESEAVGRIVRAIVDLAHGLRMDLVAEGVESEDQLAEVLRLHCEFAQGFLFAKPVDEQSATALLKNHREAADTVELPSESSDTPTTPMTARNGSAGTLAPSCVTAHLIGLAGPRAGATIPLAADVLVFGRGFLVDVSLPDNHMSRRHAQILRQDDGTYVLEDCGSTNGTYCNGQRIERCPLHDNDRLRLGTSVFELRVKQPNR